jgi:hypothetical protein
MSAAAVPYLPSDRGAMSRLLRAGLLTGVVDGLWAIVLTVIYQRSVTRLFQGIAATPFGESMFNGGLPTAALGLVMHFGVAFAWSALFLLLVTRSRSLRDLLDTPYGPLKIATVYGPVIWIVMSVVLIPLFVHRPVAINIRWWIQLAGHIVFVGLPITWSIGRGPR